MDKFRNKILIVCKNKMTENQTFVCDGFQEAISVLKGTFKMFVPLEVLEKVKEAIAILNSTAKPLLKDYNDGEFCKELYCDVRDFRETAISFLDFAEKTLEKFGSEIDSCTFGDVDDYIREAICWIWKAFDRLGCDNFLHSSFSHSCDTSCDSSSCSFDSLCSSDACDSSCSSDSCDSSCSSSSSSCSDSSCSSSSSCRSSCSSSSSSCDSFYSFSEVC